MKRTKGLSMAVTAALLILVSIAIVAALWLYSQRFTQGGDVVQAQANLISNRWVSNKPIYTVDLSIQSKTQTRLHLKEIDIIVTDKSGATKVAKITESSGRSGATWQFNANGAPLSGATVTPAPPVYIQPNGITHLTISLTGNTNTPVVEVAFQLILEDDAGNTYTVQTNSLTVG